MPVSGALRGLSVQDCSIEVGILALGGFVELGLRCCAVYNVALDVDE